MKVLLLNSPWINNEKEYGIKSGTRWAAVRKKDRTMPYFPFPYFMAMAKTYLRKAGIDAHIKDAVAEELSVEQCLEFVSKMKPEVLLIEVFTPSIYIDLAFAKQAKELSSCFIVFCGAHATALPEDMLKNDFVDFVLLGEYSDSLRQLCRQLSGHNPEFASIGGLGYKEKGRIVINSFQNSCSDFEEIVYPQRDELPMEKYNEPLSKNHSNARIVTSRGCPYACMFCVEPLMYKKNYQQRSIDNIIAEIKMLQEMYGIKEIIFDDALFTISRVKQIAKAILENKIDIAWLCWIDWNISFDDLKLIKESGCIAVKFGIESADFKKVKLIGKNLEPEKLEQLIKNCKKLKILAHASFMLGLPGETRESLQDTVDFAFSLNLDSCQFTIATPLPGTPFYEMAVKNEWLITDDWAKFDSLQSCVLKYPGCNPEDVVRALEQVRQRKIRLFLSNPLLALRYIWKIFKLKGVKGFGKEVITKGNFVLKSMLRLK